MAACSLLFTNYSLGSEDTGSFNCDLNGTVQTLQVSMSLDWEAPRLGL